MIEQRHDVPARPVTPDGSTPARRFAQFAAVCLVLSWGPLAVVLMFGTGIDSGVGRVLFVLATAGPSLTALVLWLVHRPERGRAGVPTVHGIVAGLLLGAAAPVIAALAAGNGPAGIGAHAASAAAAVGGPLVVIGYTLATGPLAEEFGWRGYLQPRLRQRFGRVRTAAVLGVAWSAWHLPLFAVPGTSQYAKGLGSVSGICLLLTFLPLSYLMLFVTERLRGGVWAAIGLHASWNASGALLPEPGATGALLEVAFFVVAAAAVAVRWRRMR